MAKIGKKALGNRKDINKEDNNTNTNKKRRADKIRNQKQQQGKRKTFGNRFKLFFLQKIH